MPSGDVHTAINLGTLAILAGVSAVVHVPAAVIGPFAAGMLVGTLLITPDLDLAGHVRVRARKNWGVWGNLWRPLSLFVRHRGVTHTFLRGPALLLAYAAGMLGLIVSAVQVMLRAAPVPMPLNLPVPAADHTDLIGALAGYLLAHWLHVWMDGYRPWQLSRW